MLTDPRDNRPVILVEYLYQIRNTGGGMHKFIDLIRRYERFQGGYIWDWQDKALPGRTEDGREYFAHGGDFSEHFIDPTVPLYMTNNGIVRGDLVWKPVAWEVREAYAPLLIDRPMFDGAWSALAGRGMFSVMNHTLNRNSGEFAVSVILRSGEGEEIACIRQEIPELKPGEQTKPLFTTVTFDTAMDNPYMNARVEIDIHAQAVQSKNNGTSALDAIGWSDAY